MARQVEWQSCFVRAATLCLFPDIEPEFGCFQWNIALIFTLSRTLKPAVSMAQPNKIQIPPLPRFHPIARKVTQRHPSIGRGAQSHLLCIYSVFKELALYLQRAHASLYRILFAYVKCPLAW